MMSVRMVDVEVMMATEEDIMVVVVGTGTTAVCVVTDVIVEVEVVNLRVVVL